MRNALFNILRRLRQDESGNVLYMTLILILMLASFTLVTANVIYMGVMKAKAQNAADQLALSAAALKARLLNRIANYNAALYIATEFDSVKPGRPYESPVTGIGAQIAMAAVYIAMWAHEFPEYHKGIHQDRWLDRIAKENGLNEQTSRFGLYPVQMNMNIPDPTQVTSFATELSAQSSFLAFLAPPLPAPVPLIFCLTAIEPAYDWYVQSRVEWKTHKAAIGGATLGIELPDIVTRSRADLFDKLDPSTSMLPTPVRHNWRVRLAKVDENVDREIRRLMRSRNTGQGSSGASQAPNMPAGYEAWMDEHGEFSEEQFEDHVLGQMSQFDQYNYYRNKLAARGLSAREKIKYYNIKKNITGLSFAEQLELWSLQITNR